MGEKVYTVVKVMRELNIDPEDAYKHLGLISKEADMSENSVRKIIRINRDYGSMISLEMEVGDERDSTLADFIPSKEISTDDEALETITRETVLSELGILSEKERRVIEMRFGLDGDGREYYLEEVATEFGLSREGVRKIEIKALKKLRRNRTLRHLYDNM